MQPILSIANLSKTYAGGHQALSDVTLDIAKGEIFALLGPNGAGKTTLIGAVCGLVRPTGGTITFDGKDMATHWRLARARIGLVPHEVLEFSVRPDGVVDYGPEYEHWLSGRGTSCLTVDLASSD